MSRVASSNLFDILGDDEEVVAPVQAPVAAGKAAAKKPAAAAAPAAASAQKQVRNNSEPARDAAPAEDANFNRQNRRPTGRPPREETKNDRHLARNGASREISKAGGGRGNWGGDLDENRTRGPNSKKLAEEPVAEPEPLADGAVVAPEADAAAAAVAAGGDAAAADAAPAVVAEPDPADKFIGLDEFLAQKEAKRVAEDLNIKVRDVIVDDKQFKHIKVAVSEKDVIENDFSDLKIAKKGKKEKAANKRAQLEAIDMYPVGAVPHAAPRSFGDRPQGDRPPRTEGDFRGRGRGGFRGGRGAGRGGAARGGAAGTNLRDEDFPSLVQPQ